MRWIILDPNSRDWIKRLSREQKWELLEAIFSYNIDWEIVEMTDMVWMAFDMMKWFFDKQIIEYKETCLRNAENWKKWWRPKNKLTQTDSNPENPDGFLETHSKPIKPNQTKPNQNKQKEIIISSKEDTQALVIPEEKKEYWDPTINLIIRVIKSHNNWLIDWTIQSNRRYGKMLRDKIDKIVWFNWDYEWFLSNLIEKTDQYNISKTTSCESIYYNLATLVKKIQATNIEAQKETKKIYSY